MLASIHKNYFELNAQPAWRAKLHPIKLKQFSFNTINSTLTQLTRMRKRNLLLFFVLKIVMHLEMKFMNFSLAIDLAARVGNMRKHCDSLAVKKVVQESFLCDTSQQHMLNYKI